MQWYHWLLMVIFFVLGGSVGWWIRSKFDKQIEAIQAVTNTTKV